MEKTKRRSLVLAAGALLLVLAAVFFFLLRGGPAALKQNPLALGKRYLTELDYEQAVLSFTKAIEIDPNTAAAYLGRAEAYVGLGDTEHAQADIVTLVEVYQTIPVDELQQIIDTRTDELNEDPTAQEALLDRGAAELAQGDTEGGAKDFDDLIALVPVWEPVLQPILDELAAAEAAEAEQAAEAARAERYSRLAWAVEPGIEAADINVLRAYWMPFEHVDVAYNFDYNLDHRMVSGPMCTIQTADMQYGMMDYAGHITADSVYSEIYYDDKKPYVLLGSDRAAFLSMDGLLTECSVEEADETMLGGTPGLLWCIQDGQLYESGAFDNGCQPVEYSAPCAAECYPSLVRESDSFWSYDYRDFMGYILMNNGKPISDELYEDAGCFVDGVIAVKKDGFWGYVDINGNTVIPFTLSACCPSVYFYQHQLDCAYDPSEGYIVANQDGAYMLYDTAGSIVIEPGIFEALRPVYNGKCWAKQNGLWGVLSLTGEGTPVTIPAAQAEPAAETQG